MIKLKSILVIIVALRVRVGSPVENTHCVIKINSTCGVLFYILEKKRKRIEETMKFVECDRHRGFK